MNLLNLPHTDGAPFPCIYFKTPKRALRLLSRKRAVMDAGDHGVIGIHYGNDGCWHARLCRSLITVEEFTCPTKAELLPWLEKFHPTIK